MSLVAEAKPLFTGNRPAALQLTLSALNQIKSEKKTASQSLSFTAMIKRAAIARGYFGPNETPRAIMTRQQNYARTAANSFRIISAQTCGFSSCFFTGRTSTCGNERAQYYSLVADNVAISPLPGYPLAFSW